MYPDNGPSICFDESGNSGLRGQIPDIHLYWEDLCWPIPPIDSLSSISIVHIPYPNLPNTQVILNWRLEHSQIHIKCDCYLDDERLRTQYPTSDITEQISEFVARASQGELKAMPDGKPKRGMFTTAWGRMFYLGNIIPRHQIPECYSELINQIEKWEEFFRIRKYRYLVDDHPFGGLFATIEDDGYYAFNVGAGELYIPGVSLVILDRLSFDRDSHPPAIADDCIFWDLPDARIRVILPHAKTNHDIIEYYGYTYTFEKFKRDLNNQTRRRRRREEESARRKIQKTEELSHQLRDQLTS